MPRKKTETQPEAPEASTSSTAKTPRTRRTPAKPAAKASPEPAVEAAKPAPKPRTRKIGAPDPEPVVEAKPKATRTRRKAEPVAEPVAETPAVGAKPARTRARRKPAAADTSAPVEEKAPAPKARTRRAAKSADSDALLEAVAAEAVALSVTPPTWRTPVKPAARKRTDTQETDEGPAAPAAEGGEDGLAPRRSRRRRRRRSDDDAAPAEAPAQAADDDDDEPAAEVERPAARRRGSRTTPPAEPEPEPEVRTPKAPVRPAIDTPEDAPQVVLRDGVPTLVRSGRVYPPIQFFGSASDEARSATILDEMKLAGEAGIHLHSHMIEFDVDEDAVDANASLAAYLLAKTLEVDPEAQVLFRIVFVAGRGWQEQFPEARYVSADGSVAEPSVCDERFWGLAKHCLQLFTRKLRLLEAKDHILGVHLERGEWFFADGWGYDTSPAAQNAFRMWCRNRYLNDAVALRAAWFDGRVDFDTLRIPEYQQPEAEPKFVRSARKERRWVDYHLFLSDATCERIGDLAYSVKEASSGYLLVGASYGYTFEWSHPGSGHLSLGKLLRHPNIDFIAGPPSYKSRQPGGAAPFPCPVDSFALNGKLYISEEDFKTSIGQGVDLDDFNPVIKTPQALESVHWRGAGSALAHSSGVSWMDLWGNGWLRSHGIWERGAAVCDALIRRMAAPPADPDLAIFIDERALAYLVDQEAFSILVQDVRESVLRSGMSAGFYLLSDLAHREHFPESKLYVFLNAWDMRPELRAAIKTRLQRDNKVLFWLYAAGLFESGRESLERAREVTGIALKPQPFHSKSGTTILNRRHPLCEAFQDRTLVGGMQLEPSYFAIPEEATVLGEYSATGLPSFVVKEFRGDDASQNWTSVFMGEPVVTPGLIRTLGQLAGVHVWNFQEDVVHVRPPFLTVHCTGTGQRTIALPNKWAVYDLLHQDWITTDSMSLKFHAVDGSTHLFLVGVRAEIEAILAMDPAEILTMAELPPKPENTAHFDAASFDVPIMKLGEFMDGGPDEEGGDEFLLRPVMAPEPDLDMEPDMETTSTGRRRRRRRRRGGADRAPTDTTSTAIADSDFDMNVVFRKRE